MADRGDQTPSPSPFNKDSAALGAFLFTIIGFIYGVSSVHGDLATHLIKGVVMAVLGGFFGWLIAGLGLWIFL
jgi:hypothetical protein